VRAHLRLVIKMASKFAGYGYSLDDLVSEGSVGLIEAINRFEPDRGLRVSTYATFWINSYLKTHVMANWSLVKLGSTTEQKRLFFGLRRAKAALDAYESGHLRPEVVARIAADMDVSPRAVEAMNARLMGDGSLNAPAGEEGDMEWLDTLVDDAPGFDSLLEARDEGDKRRAALREALDSLKPREREIFEKRRLLDEPMTLEELSQVHGVSRERIRQIEVTAFEKVADALRAIAGRQGFGRAH